MECGRCGRELKDKASIKRGFGPVCWAKVQAEEANAEAQKEDK
jgi:hypothetical protein